MKDNVYPTPIQCLLNHQGMLDGRPYLLSDWSLDGPEVETESGYGYGMKLLLRPRAHTGLCENVTIRYDKFDWSQHRQIHLAAPVKQHHVLNWLTRAFGVRVIEEDLLYPFDPLELGMTRSVTASESSLIFTGTLEVSAI